jgi:hypothetical protein
VCWASWLRSRIPQLANVAGYLHDIGNAIHRQNHALSGSLMAWGIMKRMGMSPQECALAWIGNHEEERARRRRQFRGDHYRRQSRCPPQPVQNHAWKISTSTIVNYAAKRSFVRVKFDEKNFTRVRNRHPYAVIIFRDLLSRMTMMRQAWFRVVPTNNDTQFA